MPATARRRVIIDTDAKNEADDQYAIVHALLSPTLDVEALIPAHFRRPGSQAESRAEVDLLLGLLGLADRVAVHDGAIAPMGSAQDLQDSPGARALVRASLVEGSGTLFIACLGALTNVAAALLLDPGLAQRDVVLVWIGGPPRDGTDAAYWPEYNLAGDRHAANVVFASGMTIWQVPMPVYLQMGVSYAELHAKVAPHGPLGDYLVRQTVEWNRAHVPEPIEYRSLGDTPAIGLVLSPFSGAWRTMASLHFDEEHRAAETDGAPVRVYTSVDSRYFLEDMFAKIAALAAGRPAPLPTTAPRSLHA